MSYIYINTNKLLYMLYNVQPKTYSTRGLKSGGDRGYSFFVIWQEKYIGVVPFYCVP